MGHHHVRWVLPGMTIRSVERQAAQHPAGEILRQALESTLLLLVPLLIEHIERALPVGLARA